MACFYGPRCKFVIITWVLSNSKFSRTQANTRFKRPSSQLVGGSPPHSLPHWCLQCLDLADLPAFGDSLLKAFRASRSFAPLECCLQAPMLWFQTQVQVMTTRFAKNSVCTHAQSISFVDVLPTVKWVIPSSQSESDATTNTLTTAEWTLVSQHFWTCLMWPQDGRHHPQSHSHTASRTHASSLIPTFPAADHSASTTEH